MLKFNSFHLLEPSPWPLTSSFSFLSFGLGVVIMVTLFDPTAFLMSILLLLYSSIIWSMDIHREGCYSGDHSPLVEKGFKVGMIIFIFSEVFFFLGIFWSYFHLAEAPSMDLGLKWPPSGVYSFDPKGIPFLNTVLLVSSGVSVTWSHHSMEKGLFKKSLLSLLVTVLLGAVFTSLQLFEYLAASFTFACSSFSSVYFMGTGFHGLHVLIGSLLLLMCLLRFSNMYISVGHSAGFECSVWYWHFVDIVWFLLYLIFYWWGI